MQNTYELANQRVGKAPFTRVVSTTSANHRQREYNLREKINKMRILSENDDKKYQFYLTVEVVLEPTLISSPDVLHKYCYIRFYTSKLLLG